MAVECSVNEPAPQVMTETPPVARPIQRSTWKTGSTSSTSSESYLSFSCHCDILSKMTADVVLMLDILQDDVSVDCLDQ